MQEAHARSLRARAAVQHGFAPDQLNPKIAVLYVSLLPQFVARTRIGSD
jgi:threonine/homoserine/homoserine lactone efflux protein